MALKLELTWKECESYAEIEKLKLQIQQLTNKWAIISRSGFVKSANFESVNLILKSSVE